MHSNLTINTPQALVPCVCFWHVSACHAWLDHWLAGWLVHTPCRKGILKWEEPHLAHFSDGIIKDTTSIISSFTKQLDFPGTRWKMQISWVELHDLMSYLHHYWLRLPTSEYKNITKKIFGHTDSCPIQSPVVSLRSGVGLAARCGIESTWLHMKSETKYWFSGQ